MSAPLIFVAGDYRSKDDTEYTNRLITMCMVVMYEDGVYICPALWHQRDYDFCKNWQLYAEDVIPSCDAFLCTDRDSLAVQDEIRIAALYEIPIFYDVPDLQHWLDFMYPRGVGE